MSQLTSAFADHSRLGMQELKAVQVLQEDGKLVPKERGITLRMLLNHTGK